MAFKESPAQGLRNTSLLIQIAKSVLLVISALFPIVDPIGGSPIFLSLTREYSPETRRILARRIAIDSFILMIASFAVGSHVLSFFGISLPVVQVGGGLIVISIGWAMLAQKDEEQEERGQVRDVSCTDVLKDAFYPLTLPLTVGPGSISVAVTLGANAPRRLVANLLGLISAAIGTAIIAGTIYLCYGFADRLSAWIGATGLKVIIKLTAFLLVCIGVQIFWNGASQLIASLPGFRP